NVPIPHASPFQVQLLQQLNQQQQQLQPEMEPVPVTGRSVNGGQAAVLGHGGGQATG
ncbi:unnamed protein product, partial [Rotaria sp. Silwood2]